MSKLDRFPLQSRRRRDCLKALGLAGAAGLAPAWTLAQDASTGAPVAIRDLLRDPAIANVQISPDGAFLCGVREVNGRRNLMVVDLATRKATIITNLRDADVAGARWINSRRIVFGVVDRERGSGDQTASGLFAIDRDANNFRVLAGRERESAAGARPLPASTMYRARSADPESDEIYVTVWSSGGTRRASSSIHKLNTRNGQSEIVSLGGPANTNAWVLDAKRVPRAAVARQGEQIKIHWRDSEASPWREVASYPANDPGGFTPVGIDADGTAYVLARVNSDFAAIHRFDPQTGKPEPTPVFSLKGFDLDGDALLFNREHRLVGIDYDGERSGTYWLDPKRREIQETIDKALPGKVNKLQFTPTRVLVSSYSDQDPGRYLVYDPAKDALEQVGASRPWIDPRQMAQTNLIRYKARDGLEIPAMLTLPRGKNKNLPLVVMHYGGPWVRTLNWGFDPRVQFLASRGYAVLMPSNRGSLGLGYKHFKAGWKQWGLAMQDDLTDGARQLIAQGVVDPKRVCMMGASYGGYATMQGLAKEPELFRCGVNWVGVTDPDFMFSVPWADFAGSEAADYDLATLIGDPKADAEQFRITSPVRNAHKIKQPVLMAYGGLDQRVPIINGERMRDALKPHNPNVEWVVYGDEGHNFLKLENNLDFLTRVEKFLAANLSN